MEVQKPKARRGRVKKKKSQIKMKKTYPKRFEALEICGEKGKGFKGEEGRF